MKSKNIVDYFKKVRMDKKEYNAKMDEIAQLPEEYQYVFKEIQKFLWEFTAGDGMDMMNGIYGLADFFIEGAQRHTPILELVGEDVGEFAENTLHEIQAKTRTDQLKKKMNERITKKLGDK